MNATETWNSIPNFGDENAKVSESVHRISGARKIEVTYDLLDEAGNPITPQNAGVDAHGHWIALELDSVYHVIYWRKPLPDGTFEEYGTDDDSILPALEADLEKRNEIINEVFDKLRAGDLTSFEEYTAQWNSIKKWGAPNEEKLEQRWERACAKYQESIDKEEARVKNIESKKALIAQADEISGSDDWKQTAETMDALMEQWKQIGHCGREEDEALWEEFRTVRKKFYDRRNEENVKRREARRQNREIKEGLIAECKELVENFDSYKQTRAAIETLFERWKATGSAGYKEDNRLWQEFNGLRHVFFDKSQAFYQDQENQRKENRQAKSILLSEAQQISREADFSPAAVNKMIDIQARWKKIGPAEREYNEELWTDFKAVMDNYFKEKNSFLNQKHEAWVAKTQNAIDRRREKLANIIRNNEKLQDRLDTTHNEEKIEQIADGSGASLNSYSGTSPRSCRAARGAKHLLLCEK